MNAAHWKFWLFFGTTPILLAIYTHLLFTHYGPLRNVGSFGWGVRVSMIVLSFSLFIFAVFQFWIVKLKWKKIDEEIETAASFTNQS
jgi:hypothetical protein